jgi:hypothetical protein
MTFSNGVDAHMIYTIESTPGTRATPATAVPLIQESMSDSGSQPIWRPGIIKGRRTRHGSDRSKSDVGGQVSVPLTAESCGGLLGALIGTTNTTGAGPYEHVFTPGSPESFSMQIAWDDSAGTAFRKDYIGCLMDGGTLDVQANQHPTMQFDIKALSEEDDAYADITPSYATLQYFEFSDFVVAFDGGSDECFDSASISWANNLYQSPAICPTNPRATVYEDSGMHMVTGTIGQDFTAWAKYAKFAAGTAATLQVTGTAGANAIIDIEMAIIFTGETPQVGGPERIKQGLPFEVVSGTDDATAVTVTLTSNDATV